MKNPGGRGIARSRRAREREDAPPIHGSTEWYPLASALAELSCLSRAVVLAEIASGELPSSERTIGGRVVIAVHRDDLLRRLERVPIPLERPRGTGHHEADHERDE